jgi:hypothetical protein
VAGRRDPAVDPVDPFDLPEWVGEGRVTWRASTSLAGSPLVSGDLTADHGAGGPDHGSGVGSTLECDVLACDPAYPLPVLTEAWRHDAHQAWELGEVLLVRYDGRLTLVVPGTVVTAEPTLEAVRRLARAVGSKPDRFTVALRL